MIDVSKKKMLLLLLLLLLYLCPWSPQGCTDKLLLQQPRCY
jgi:hypothetical protein